MAYRYESRVDNLYNLITGDEDARVCRDIPESACNDQPRNFFSYLFANLFNKIADELTSAKLILPWLMTSLGVPLAYIGFLLPIRETGVLLPQLFVAAVIRQLERRKPVWLLGGLLSTLSLAGMLIVALTLQGRAAGIGSIVMLIIFSLSRGLCSVSAKDVLGKTVSKSRRGVLMGYSASIGGIVVLFIGVMLAAIDLQKSSSWVFVILLGISIVMWVFSLISFAMIIEQPGATEGGGSALDVMKDGLRCLYSDSQFRQFVIVRIMMLAVALAPPFYVLLAQQWLGEDISILGYLIIASGVASSLSSPFWGKWGDRSSRRVMIYAASGAALLGLMMSLSSWLELPYMKNTWVHVAGFMLLIIVHSGIRLGRKVYLVDMATMDNRAMYVAVSNTIIGIAMMTMSLIGLLSSYVGITGIIFLLASMSVIAALLTTTLNEVSVQ